MRLMVWTKASTLDASRPSLKFGTHSISLFICLPGLPPAAWLMPPRRFSANDRFSGKSSNCASGVFPGKEPLMESLSVSHVHHFAALHGQPASVYPKIVGNFPIVRHLEDAQVGLLA